MQPSGGRLLVAGWTAATPYNLPLRGKLAIESYIVGVLFLFGGQWARTYPDTAYHRLIVKIEYPPPYISRICSRISVFSSSICKNIKKLSLGNSFFPLHMALYEQTKQKGRNTQWLFPNSWTASARIARL
jgi:hypothetical protein